jgi:exodeoxyribonuclease VII large subunit
METDSKYLTVSDLNYYITQKFKNDPYLHKVFLQGELSNFRYRRNSHQYFSLKDDKAKIDVVMFRSYFNKVQFKPEEGMKVYVTGYVSVYAPHGSYQFYAETMEPAGLGALYEKLKQLEAKLSKEGLFAASHKRPLPHFPDKIAVVTSASGAVIHDIMVTANRRFPHAEIDLYPAQVQGDAAADSLVAAMQQIAASDDYDLMIIGRGGGSLEDLWPFNEEKVVRQVYAMPIPVISSVGHETDTTLCDLVADQRAATPTAAAEYATPNLSDELVNLHQLQSRLLAGMQAIIRQKKERLAQINNSVIMREPTRLYDQQAQTVDLLTERLKQAIKHELKQNQQTVQLWQQKLLTVSPKRELTQTRQTAAFLQQKLAAAINNYLEKQENNLKQRMQQLDDYSPLRTLKRGYSYVTSPDAAAINTAKAVTVGQELLIHFQDGQVLTKAEKVGKNNGKQEK